MISVIVPVYNTVRYLEECLESIARQDVDHEIVIIDNGSDDGSEEICRRWSGRQGVRLLHLERGGLSAARNAGLQVAEGDFVTFVDSDDMLLAGALGKLFEMARRHPGCGIISGQLTRDKRSGDGSAVSVEEDAATAIGKTLYQKANYNPSACGKLFRRYIFESELFVANRRYEDLESFARFYRKAGRIATTDAYVYYYRPNPASFINTYSPSRKDMLWATQRLIGFVGEYYPQCLAAARSRRFSALCNMFNLSVAASDAETATECFGEIARLRLPILADRNVRAKNKVAALLSVGGYRLFRAVSSVIGK